MNINIIKMLIPKRFKSFFKMLIGKINVIHVDKKSAIKEILLKNWGNYKVDLYPKNRKMQILKEKGVVSMTSENTMFLINEIVRKFAAGGVYLEIGIFQGASLLSAALSNKTTRCIGIDDFSKLNPDNDNENILKQNLMKFGRPENIEYYNMEYKECIKYLFHKEPNLKVNVYLYDAEHSFENQLNALYMMLPYLAEKCVILIDNANWEAPPRANKYFLKNHRDFKSAFKIQTKGDKSLRWGGGLEVITRGI